MLEQRTQLASAALAAAMLFLMGCDVNDRPADTTTEDRTITQAPEAERPDTTRPEPREDVIEGRTEADGIDVERTPETQGDPQRPQDTPQQQEGIEVDPAQ